MYTEAECLCENLSKYRLYHGEGNSLVADAQMDSECDVSDWFVYYATVDPTLLSVHLEDIENKNFNSK